MDPLHFAIAFAPLGAYLIRLGVVHLRPHPTVVGGHRDLAAAALAISGLIVVGPMELFMPETAATRFGWLVWGLLLSFYGMCIVLALLMARPRLVVYNVGVVELRQALSEVVKRLDPAPQWAGDSVLLPSLEINFHLDDYRATRCAAVVALGDAQNWHAWQHLHDELAAELNRGKGLPHLLGVSLCLSGLALLALSVYWLAANPQLTAQRLADFLRL